MDIHVERMPPAATADPGVLEIVERKGLGHPDTICDALAEEFSRGLSRFYVDRFGLVLHHNVDKVLLWGGVARPAFGGGEIVEPIELYLAGRATMEYEGVQVPVHDIAHEVCERWLRASLHEFDPKLHLKIHVLMRPGSADLVDLFVRQQRTGIWLANDTSCGVGYAPTSTLERSVLAAERALVAQSTTAAHPAFGEDVKVMGVRRAERLDFTVACALIGRHLRDLDDYLDNKLAVADVVRSTLATDELGDIEVNTADDPSAESIYLTVIGTSAEAGDDGQAGRGNRANGLITPFRTMTMESVAGKNPVSHVGKLYNVAASRIASELVRDVAAVTAAQCALVSQIGAPVSSPQVVAVRIMTADDQPVESVRSRVAEITRRNLEQISEMWKEIVAGEVSLY